jgi:CheY-like chemotaxis protein
VDQVESGEAAVVATEHADAIGAPYDIVFLDWKMPGMDGIETSKRIREHQLSQVPHMIMVTAYAREDIIKAAEEAGIQDVLIKPVSASVLFDGVVRVLGGVVEGEASPMDFRTDTFQQLSTIKGASILLVEDNELNQEVATELLLDAGFIVDLAEDGQIALDKVRSNNYDVVLMDMQMPVMDGVAATIEIRKQARFDNLPIVAMTASAMQGDRDRCLASGMNDHVAKPIEPEELWKALLKWVKPPHTMTAIETAEVNPRLPIEQDTILPAAIEGLDMESGLRRVLGKRPLYLSMLRKFAAGQKSTPAAILKALEDSDWKTAERLAHTLKGLSGNIGATGLQQLAEKFEVAIKERQPREEIDAQLGGLKQQLDHFIDEMVEMLPNKSGKANVTIDREKLKTVCSRLEALLDDDDAEAADVLDANAELLNTAFPNHYQQIEDGIRSFDFEVALNALKGASSV